jgi:MoaA/NifB/PqqE/SkfB family radical SAM enzyme
LNRRDRGSCASYHGSSAGVDSPTFCVVPWLHFHTATNGDVRLCCVAKGPLRNEDGSAFNIRRDPISEIWNSKSFKNVRQRMLMGEKVSDCQTCYLREQDQLTSLRQIRNEAFKDRTSTLNTLIAKKPIAFDVRLGNLCNLKCRMCWWEASSQIEMDEIDAASERGVHREPIGRTIADWPEAKNLLKDLKTFIAEATHIDLVGGEPTLNHGQLDLLEFLVAEGLSSRITLVVISNLTSKLERPFDLFEKFKRPQIVISLDGFGDVYDYIRFPAKWSVVADNVKFVKANYPDLSLSVSPTFQAYNILNICDLFDWCLDNKIDFSTNGILTDPSYLSVLVLPEEARQIAAERLDSWVESREDAYAYKFGIDHISSYLRDGTNQALQHDVNEFVVYTNNLDKSRKQNIRQSLPDLFRIWSNARPWSGPHYLSR